MSHVLFIVHVPNLGYEPSVSNEGSKDYNFDEVKGADDDPEDASKDASDVTTTNDKLESESESQIDGDNNIVHADPHSKAVTYAVKYEENQEPDTPLDDKFKRYLSFNLAKALDMKLKSSTVARVTWTKTSDGKQWQVVFPVEYGDSDQLLNSLLEIGVGNNSFSDISIVPVTVHFPSLLHEARQDVSPIVPVTVHFPSLLHEARQDVSPNVTAEKLSSFAQSVKSRLIVAQEVALDLEGSEFAAECAYVISVVKNGSRMTFDYIMLIIMASIIAAVGLVENSSVLLVASMLISPLMGPILGGTFGIVISYKQLWKMGIKNELLGLLLCMVCGFLFGLISGFAIPEWGKLTDEMISRGAARSLYVGVLVAIPSGAGVAFSILGGNQGSLVGVAISASLLPPAVNAGLCWAFAIVTTTLSSDSSNAVPTSHVNTTTMPTPAPSVPLEKELLKHYDAEELLRLGAISLTLTIVNILIVIIMGVIVLKIKEVAPGTSTAITKDFWKSDLEKTRQALKKSDSHVDDTADTLMQEWNDMNKTAVHSQQTTKGKQAEQLSAQLKAILENIQNDERANGVIGYLPQKPERPMVPVDVMKKLDIEPDNTNDRFAVKKVYWVQGDPTAKSRFQVEPHHLDIQPIPQRKLTDIVHPDQSALDSVKESRSIGSRVRAYLRRFSSSRDEPLLTGVQSADNEDANSGNKERDSAVQAEVGV